MNTTPVIPKEHIRSPQSNPQRQLRVNGAAWRATQEPHDEVDTKSFDAARRWSKIVGDATLEMYFEVMAGRRAQAGGQPTQEFMGRPKIPRYTGGV